MQNQKSAVLAKNRDQLIDLMDKSRFKRANTVKVYKDFASVVTFLDDKGDDIVKGAAMLTHPVLKDVVVMQSQQAPLREPAPVSPKAPITKQETSERKSDTAHADNQTPSATPTDVPEEKGKSHYWDTKFV